jgi:FtsZ-binding cell division protein ZapB
MDQLKDQKNQLVEANSRLTQENALQKQKIHNLERENQSLARQLKEKQKQEPEA